MHLTLPTTLLATLLPVAFAIDFTLYLPSRPNPFTLPASTHATLNSLSAHHSAPISAVNTFVFHNVTQGSYLVDVFCATDGFHPLRVDVGKDGEVEVWETFRGNEWGNKGESVPVREGVMGKGVEVRALGSKMYFMERPKFSILTIFKNPMILMSLGTMGLVFGMPYIMDKMDPELKAELESKQRSGPMANMQQGGSPLGNFDMAAYLAGSDNKDSSGSASGGGASAKNQGVRR